MNEKTDAPPPPAAGDASQRQPAVSPRFALFVATACGLGYIPIAPGTFGSLAGLLLALLPFWGFFGLMFLILRLVGTRESNFSWMTFSSHPIDVVLCAQIVLAILVAVVGVWSANCASEFWAIKDPQRVVIDEVSGQHLTLLLGCGLPIAGAAPPGHYSWPIHTLGLITAQTALNWKYLLLGLILFRVFDIWKPFPVRQAESLPGGWGIMADDWVAAIYAGLGLWIARAAGL